MIMDMQCTVYIDDVCEMNWRKKELFYANMIGLMMNIQSIVLDRIISTFFERCKQERLDHFQEAANNALHYDRPVYFILEYGFCR